MHVATVQFIALSSLFSLTRASPCGYSTACVSPDATYAPCTPETAAEFELVAPLLQQCDDITSYFTRGAWSFVDRKLHCDVNSPCGSIVPYIVNTHANDRVCDQYKQFVYVLATFRWYCKDEPVAQIQDDNGLLASLKSNSRTRKPTPAPTSPVGVDTPEPIPIDETPTGSPSSSLTPAPAATQASSTASTSTPDTKSNDANSKTSSDAFSLISSTSKALAAAMTVLVAGANVL